MRRLSMLVLALVFGGFARDAGATTITYTFDAPSFIVGQTTPLLNRAPNIGPATFLTSFTDLVDPAAFTVAIAPQNALMLGPALLEPGPPNSALTMTFSEAITSLSVSFAVNATTPGALLRLVTPSGSFNQVAGVVGGTFPGGTLTFTGAPFTTATLQGFLATGAPTQIAIDNLTLETAAVPEPSTLVLLGLGGAVLIGRRVARRT